MHSTVGHARNCKTHQVFSPKEARRVLEEDCYVDNILTSHNDATSLDRITEEIEDPGDFQYEGYPYKRLRIIQSEVNTFWRKWCQLAGQNLIVRSKWHTKEKNVAVGDIVWLADQNALRGQFKLARVIRVNPDKKGIVRDVEIRTFPSYPIIIIKPSQGESVRHSIAGKKPTNKIPATILHRDIRRLILLVPVE